MPHTDADGGRTIDVVCACGCASVTRIRLDPDAPGRERAVMRADRIRLYDIIDRITEESDEYRKLMDMARTEDASRFAAIVARIIEMGAAGLCTAEDVRRELGAARMALRAASGSHNPEDLRRIGELEAEVRRLKSMLKYYETPNSRRGMPPLSNHVLKKFDEEIIASCCSPKPPASRGPAMDHPGVSHDLHPEKTLRYRAARRCPVCLHPRLVRLGKTVSKIFVEWDDADGRTHVYQLRLPLAWCVRCRSEVRPANAPDIEGTCFGPALISKFIILYALGATDRKLAEQLEGLLNASFCPSTIMNARMAAARVLEPFMKHLEKLIVAKGWAHFDETTMRMFGKQGYLWVVAVACAAMVVARPSRGMSIFDEELAFARHLVGVVDGYKLYEIILDEIQRCWRHVINNFKKAAATADDPVVRAAYGDFCGLYERIKDMDTAPKEVRDAIVEEALAIARRLPEGHPSRTEIENAGANLVTFLMFKDMPPTNNPVEGDIRGDPVAQRNVRYQLRTEEGARAFSVIVSFILTCKKQGVRLDKAFIALAGGADPADLFKVGQVAPNRWGGPKKAPRRGKGPLDGLARAAAEAAEPEPEPEPVAAEPEPEPVAAEPEPEPEPEPEIEAVAAEPEPEPEPEIEAVAAEPEPEPEIEAVAAEPEIEAVAAEPEPEPEPEIEAVAAEPEPEPEIEAVAAEPEPEPVAAKPEPVAAKPEPEPVAAKPEPEPVAAKPEPVAAKPEPEPVAAKPEPKAEPEAPASAPAPPAGPPMALPSSRAAAAPRPRRKRRPAAARAAGIRRRGTKARQGRRMPHRQAAPRPRRPPKPPPRIRLRIRSSRRPRNGHIPIRPSVPPPCVADDPKVRVHPTEGTGSDKPSYQGAS